MSRESNELQRVIDKTIRERLNALSLMNFKELALLPSHHSEDVVFDGKKIALSVWHDVLPSQEHRVVVQAYKPGILGIGRMQADGFAINNRDEKRSLTVEEWAPFS